MVGISSETDTRVVVVGQEIKCLRVLLIKTIINAAFPRMAFKNVSTHVRAHKATRGVVREARRPVGIYRSWVSQTEGWGSWGRQGRQRERCHLQIKQSLPGICTYPQWTDRTISIAIGYLAALYTL